MLVFGKDDVTRALPMREAVGAMRSAFAAYSGGRVVMPLRTRVGQPDGQGVFFTMPVCGGEETGHFTVKMVSVFPDNPAAGLPSVHAAVFLMSGMTGSPLAILEGRSLTALRTGAASGAATDLLARKNSRVLALIGAGAQAMTQLAAVCTVRKIDEVRVYARNPEGVNRFIDAVRGKDSIPETLIAAPSPAEAVRDADIICTATTSPVPVFSDRDISRGVHINGIGSYLPEMQEVPVATVRRAKVIVDSREAALAEAGDIIQAIGNGAITSGHIHAELGEILLGKRPGRESDREITFFKSVGIAVQDAFAAALVYRNALAQGLGQQTGW